MLVVQKGQTSSVGSALMMKQLCWVQRGQTSSVGSALTIYAQLCWVHSPLSHPVDLTIPLETTQSLTTLNLVVL